MTKEVLILRHAEAEGLGVGGDDRLRRLTPGGQAQVFALAEQLLQRECWPDAVLVSTAQRTLQTLELLQSQLTLDTSKVTASDQLYLAGYDQVFALVAGLGDDIQRLWLIGHNPGWSDMASQLCQQAFGLRPCQALWLTHAGEATEACSWVDAFTELGAWRLRESL